MSNNQGVAPNAAAHEFRCANCGAEGLRFDAEAQKMVCDHCDHRTDLPEGEKSEAIVEYDLAAGLAQAARGLGTPPRKTSKCQECGAKVAFEGQATTTSCDFCGSSQVLEQEENQSLIRPESLLPFTIDKKSAGNLFSSWLKKLWFRPSDLKAKAKLTDIQGVYVPYWTFDAHADADWTAEAGYYYYETEYYEDEEGNEKERQVRKTRWEHASGERSDDFDDVLVCASQGLPRALADKLSTFDTAALRGYDPSFLAGWKAEEYALELNDAWKIGVSKMQASQRSRCASDVPGDTHRFLQVRHHFADETFKHVLLPVWISAYRYKEKIFRFLVNGQTGEVVGKAPWSWIKIISFGSTLAAITALIVWLVRTYG